MKKVLFVFISLLVVVLRLSAQSTENKSVPHNTKSLDWGIFAGDASAGMYIQAPYFHLDLGVNYATPKLGSVRPDYYSPSTKTPSYGSDEKLNVVVGIGPQLKLWRFSFYGGLDNLVKTSSYKVWGTTIKSKSEYEAHWFTGLQIEFDSWELGAYCGDARGIGAILGIRVM